MIVTEYYGNNDWWDYYLAHHGILGQRWGVRRYQNSDGTLTVAGRERYRIDKSFNNMLRARHNTSLGQRLAVKRNRGYRADKKEIKDLYKSELKKIKESREDKAVQNANTRSLKRDYKETKKEVRISVADAIYPWQTTATNKKIQTQNLGKQFLKSVLAGGYGALIYDRLRTSNSSGRSLAMVTAVNTRITEGKLAIIGLGLLPRRRDYMNNKMPGTMTKRGD